MVEPRLPLPLNFLKFDDLRKLETALTFVAVGSSAIDDDPIPKLMTAPHFWQYLSPVRAEYVKVGANVGATACLIFNRKKYRDFEDLASFDVYGHPLQPLDRNGTFCTLRGQEATEGRSRPRAALWRREKGPSPNRASLRARDQAM